MRVSGAWLSDARTQQVLGLLADDGHTACAVGGCVRNALLGAPVTDVDIATSARPDRVMALAEGAALRAVPTGLAHGTVTVVAGGQGFEVTTLRRDVATDGRHARIAFSDRVADDAARRDFTMNALYARADGTVLDPLGGLDDLRARRVRFVGDPDNRIAEDYLRILRFFRFHAQYGANGPDAEGLAACAAGADGLARLSAERVTAELRKLLAAPDPAPAVAAMAQATWHACSAHRPAPTGPARWATGWARNLAPTRCWPARRCWARPRHPTGPTASCAGRQHGSRCARPTCPGCRARRWANGWRSWKRPGSRRTSRWAGTICCADWRAPPCRAMCPATR